MGRESEKTDLMDKSPFFFKRNIFRSGSSLAITIPSEIINQLRLKEGKPLKVGMVGEEIVIGKWKKKEAVVKSLFDVLEGVD